MSILDGWRNKSTGRQQERMVRSIVGEQMAHIAEAITSQVTYDLQQEDVGWTKSGDARAAYDLSATELELARARCVWLWHKDPLTAQRANLLQSGCFGRGISTPRATDKRVAEVLERFWDDDDNQVALTSYDAMCFANLMLMLEGERFFGIHVSATESVVKLSDNSPVEITNVLTHPQNGRRPVMYERKHFPDVYDFRERRYKPSAEAIITYYLDHRYLPYLPALSAESFDGERDSDVEHMIEAAGDDLVGDTAMFHMKAIGTGLRGFPEIYRSYDWTRSHATAVNNLASIVKALAAFAWKKKVKARTIDQLKAAAQILTTPPPGPAAMQIENENVDLQPMNVNTGHAGNQQSAIRETFLQSIRDGGFGEHWYGIADTGNLATAAAMELPAIWRIDDRQTLFGNVFSVLCNIAIDRALAAKDFPKPALPDSVDRTFDVDFPPSKPMTEGAIGTLMSGYAQVVEAGIYPEKEATYQLLQATGANNIPDLLDEMYPPEAKLEGDDDADNEEDGGSVELTEDAGPQETIVAEALDRLLGYMERR